MSSMEDQGAVTASGAAAGGTSAISDPILDIDPTSGLPISHPSPEEEGDIDPTSGLPVSSLGKAGESGEGLSFDVPPGAAATGSPAGPTSPGTGAGTRSWGAGPTFPGTGSGSGTRSWGAGPTSAHPWGEGPAGGGSPAKTRGRWAPVVVGLVVAALVGGLIGGVIGSHSGGGNGTTTVVERFQNNTSYIPRMSDPQSIIAKVEPALVSIDTRAYQSAGNGLFGGAFGSQVVEGAGTGMIISPGGLVLTNNHVINGASQIQVTLYGQTTSNTATIVGTDPSEDLAVIKIQGVSNLPTVTFADSSKVQVGDSVIAIGNALALGGSLTVTQGIVSALNRSESAGDATGGSEHLTQLIQTDAAINAGNSGGPLVNSAGQVIGMNTAVASSSAGNAPAEGIGFAIAANHIKNYLPQLEKGGVVASNKAYLGVAVVDASSVASQFQIPSSVSGAFVCAVTAGSPADGAGIQAGEVITGFNGTSVTSADGLTTAVQAAKAGEAATVSLWSAGSTLNAHLTLAVQPSNETNLPIAGQQLC